VTHEDGPMRKSVQVDELLKIGFDRAGEAWAEAPAGAKPDTFMSRAMKRGDATSSAEISGLCKRWTEKIGLSERARS
jgi:hypothetical protein